MENISIYKNPKAKVVIKVFNDKCISAATCIVQAPSTFDLNSNGIVYAKEGTWDEAERIIEAAKSCPVSAIVVEDMEGKVLFPLD